MPVSRSRPPRRFISPAFTVMRFSPIPAMTSITSFCEPLPMATITITEPIPIKTPRDARKVRVLCESSALTAMPSEEKNFIITFLLRSNGFFRTQKCRLASGVNPEYQTNQRAKHERQDKRFHRHMSGKNIEPF